MRIKIILILTLGLHFCATGVGIHPDNFRDHQSHGIAQLNSSEIAQLEIWAELKQEDRNIFTLNNTEKSQLLTLADNSTGDAKHGARNILSFVYGDQYCDCITPIEGSGNKSSSFVYSQDDIAKAMGLSMNIKPNPAIVYTSVDFTLPIGTEQAELQLINTEGKTVYSQKVSGTQGQVTLDIRYYKSGAYIFRLQAADYNISESIIIQ